MYAQSWNPHHVPFFTAVGSSIAMTLWAFLGLESACANAEVVETQNVTCRSPYWADVKVAVIYIVLTQRDCRIVPNMDPWQIPPRRSVWPSAQMFTPEVGKVIMALMIMSCCGSLLGWQFTIAQVFKLCG